MASVSSTPSTKSITLLPGECFILPKDATITSIVTSGAISVTGSNCTLPTPTSYKCGVFYFFTDDTSEDDDSAMEEEYVNYEKIVIGGTTFIIGIAAYGTSEAMLNAYVTDQALFSFKAVQLNVAPDDRRLYAVYFQVPEDLFDSTYLQISDRDTPYNLPPFEATCDEYPIPG